MKRKFKMVIANLMVIAMLFNNQGSIIMADAIKNEIAKNIEEEVVEEQKVNEEDLVFDDEKLAEEEISEDGLNEIEANEKENVVANETDHQASFSIEEIENEKNDEEEKSEEPEEDEKKVEEEIVEEVEEAEKKIDEEKVEEDEKKVDEEIVEEVEEDEKKVDEKITEEVEEAEKKDVEITTEEEKKEDVKKEENADVEKEVEVSIVTDDEKIESNEKEIKNNEVGTIEEEKVANEEDIKTKENGVDENTTVLVDDIKNKEENKEEANTKIATDSLLKELGSLLSEDGAEMNLTTPSELKNNNILMSAGDVKVDDGLEVISAGLTSDGKMFIFVKYKSSSGYVDSCEIRRLIMGRKGDRYFEAFGQYNNLNMYEDKDKSAIETFEMDETEGKIIIDFSDNEDWKNGSVYRNEDYMKKIDFTLELAKPDSADENTKYVGNEATGVLTIGQKEPGVVYWEEEWQKSFGSVEAGKGVSSSHIHFSNIEPDYYGGQDGHEARGNWTGQTQTTHSKYPVTTGGGNWLISNDIIGDGSGLALSEMTGEYAELIGCTKDSGDHGCGYVIYIPKGTTIKFTEKSINMFKDLLDKGLNYKKIHWDEYLACGGTFEGLTSLEGWFQNVNQLDFNLFKYLDLRTVNVTSMKNMFKDASIDKFSCNKDYIDTSEVVTMEGLFDGLVYSEMAETTSNAVAVQSFISELDTQNVNNMMNMFANMEYGTPDLKVKYELDITNFDTRNVENMTKMFSKYSSAIANEYDSWDDVSWQSDEIEYERNVRAHNADIISKSQKIKVGDNWSTEKVTKSDGIFEGVTAVAGKNGSIMVEGYVSDDIKYACADSYYTPGFFTGEDDLYDVIYKSKDEDGNIISTDFYKPMVGGKDYYRYTRVSVDHSGAEYVLYGFKDGDKGDRNKIVSSDLIREPSIGSTYTGKDGIERYLDHFEDEDGNVIASWYDFTIDGADETIYAVWYGTNNTKTITWKSDIIDTNVVAEKQTKIKSGSAITPIEYPSNNYLIEYGGTSYQFEYWYDVEKGESVPFELSNGTTQDLVLKAKWKALNKYTVNFVINECGSVIIPSVTVYENQKINMPVGYENGTMIVDGDNKYEILYWYKNNKDEEFYFDATKINSDITLYANVIKINTKTVSFVHWDNNNWCELEDAQEIPSKEVEAGSVIENDTGYNLNDIKDFNGKYYQLIAIRYEAPDLYDFRFLDVLNPTKIDKNMKLYFVWEKIDEISTVKFVAQKGDYNIPDQIVRRGESPSDPAGLNAYSTIVTEGSTNYRFIGWSTAKVADIEFDTIYDTASGCYVYDETVTLYGQWEETTDTLLIVTYDCNGHGTAEPTEKHVRNEGDDDYPYGVLNLINKDEHAYYQPKFPRIGDIWKDSAEDKSYRLTGWKYTDEYNNLMDIDYSEENLWFDKYITLIAQWEEVEYVTVSFEHNYGLSIDDQVIEKGLVATEPTKPRKNVTITFGDKKYKFLGWYENDPTELFDFTSPIAKNIELKANCVEIKYYDVSFVNTPFANIDTQTVLAGSYIDDPNGYVIGNTYKNASGELYRFGGWIKDGMFFDFENNPINSNTELVAQWVESLKEDDEPTGDLVTVTFTNKSSYGGDIDISFKLSDKKIKRNTVLTNIYNLEEDKKYVYMNLNDGKNYVYTFKGYYKKDGNSFDVDKENITDDVNIDLHWEQGEERSNCYTITWTTTKGNIKPIIDYVRPNNTFYYPSVYTYEMVISEGENFYQFNGKWKVISGKLKENYYGDDCKVGDVLDFDAAYGYYIEDCDVVLQAVWESYTPSSVCTIIYESAYGTINPEKKSFEVWTEISVADEDFEKNNYCFPKSPKKGDIVKKGGKVYKMKGWKYDGSEIEYNFEIDTDYKLVADWEEIEVYNVTFISDHNIIVPMQEVEKGDYATEPIVIKKGDIVRDTSTTPEKKYRLKYWEKEGETGEFDFAGTEINMNITLKAVYEEATTFIVSFENEPFEDIKEQIVFKGAYASTPSSVTYIKGKNYLAKDGKNYKFGGWIDTSTDLEFDFANTAILENKKIKADWTLLNEYVVDFVNTPFEAIDSQTIMEGDCVTEPEKKYVKNKKYFIGDDCYLFNGWKCDGTDFDFSVPITKSLTIEADWKLIEINDVTFDTGVMGDTIPTQKVYVGEYATKPENYEEGKIYKNSANEEYRFVAWLKGDKVFDIDNTPINVATDLVAEWVGPLTIDYITVEFEHQDDLYGLTINEIPAIPSTKVQKNTKLTDIDYVVGEEYYFNNGGKFKFMGLYKQDGSVFNKVTDLLVDDIKIILKWKKTAYYYDMYKGEFVSPKGSFDLKDQYVPQYDYFKEPEGLEIGTIVEEGGKLYKFNGDWTIVSGHLENYSKKTINSSEFSSYYVRYTGVKFEAVWEECLSTDTIYTISYEVAYGKVEPNEKSFLNGTSILVADSKKDKGTYYQPKYPRKGDKVVVGDSVYSLVSWKDKKTGNEVSSDFTMDKNYTLVATFDKLTTHTVKFESEYGLKIPSQVIESGKSAEEPVGVQKGDFVIAPTGDRYKFLYWYVKGGSDTVEFDFATSITSDIVLVAKYEALVDYTVTFVNTPFENIAQQTVINGNCATNPKPEYKINNKYNNSTTGNYYIFKGWKKDGANYDFSTPVTDNITITADWLQINIYDVTFDTGLIGGVIPAQEVFDGEYAEKPEKYIDGEKYKTTTGDVYKFGGWLKDDEIFDIKSTPITGTTELVAEWIGPIFIDGYTVSFDNAIDSLDNIIDPSRFHIADEKVEKNAFLTDLGGYEINKVYDIYGDGISLYKLDGVFTDNKVLFDISTTPITSDTKLILLWSIAQQYKVEWKSSKGFTDTITQIYNSGSEQLVYPDKIMKGTVVEENGKYYKFNSTWVVKSGELYMCNPYGGYSRVQVETPLNIDTTNVSLLQLNNSNVVLEAQWVECEKVDTIVKVKYESKYGVVNPIERTFVYGTELDTKDPSSSLYYEPLSPRVGDVIVESGGVAHRLIHWKGTMDDGRGTSYIITNNVYLSYSGVTTLVAEWEDYNINKVTFTSDYNVKIASQNVETGKYAVEPTTILKNDIIIDSTDGKKYRFLYWYKDDETVEFDFGTTPINTPVTLTAKYTELKECIVNFENNPFGSIDSQKVLAGGVAEVPKENYSKGNKYHNNLDGKDYIFDGWKKDDGVTDYDFATPVISDITIKASWLEIRNNDVTFDTGIMKTTIASQIVLTGECPVKPEEYKKGELYATDDGSEYRFSGWSKDGVIVEVDTVIVNKDIEFKAEWIGPITYDKVRVKFVNVDDKYREFSVKIPNIADKTIMKESKLTDYCGYVPGDTYTIDGKNYRLFEVYKKDEITDSFVYFDRNSEIISKDITLYLLWQEDMGGGSSQQVIFISEKGDFTLNPKNVYSGELIGSVDGNLSKGTIIADGGENWIFNNMWELLEGELQDRYYNSYYQNDTVNGENFVDIYVNCTTNIKLRAIWTKVTDPICTIKYESQYGKLNPTEKAFIKGSEVSVYDYNPNYYAPQTPTLNSKVYVDGDGTYKLVSWKNKATNMPITSNLYIYDDMTLVAVWEKIPTLEITFESEHGVDVPKQHVEKYENVKEPIDIKKGEYIQDATDGKKYRFEYWHESGKAEEFIFDTTSVESDITLVAKYELADECLVTFVNTPFENIASEKVVKNSCVLEPSNGYEIGKRYYNLLDDNYYIFNGWKEEGKTTNYDFSTPVTKNITIDADWQKLDLWKVSFNTGVVGNTINSQDVFDGEYATKPTNYVENCAYEDASGNSYKFTGWSTATGDIFDIEKTPITADTTLVAIWIGPLVDKYTVTFSYGSNVTSAPAIPNQEVPKNTKVINDMGYVPGVIKEFGSKKYKLINWTDGGAEFDIENDIITKNTELVSNWNDVSAYYTVKFDTDIAKVDILPKVVEPYNFISDMDDYLPLVVEDGGNRYDFSGWKIVEVENSSAIECKVGKIVDILGTLRIDSNITVKALYEKSYNSYCKVEYRSAHGDVNPTNRLVPKNTCLYTVDSCKSLYPMNWYEPISPNVNDIVCEGGKKYKLTNWEYTYTDSYGDSYSGNVVTDYPYGEMYIEYDFVLEAVWEVVGTAWTVTFDSVHSIKVDSQDVEDGGCAIMPTAISTGDIITSVKDGLNYEFKYWENKSTGEKYDFSNSVTKNIDLVAVWEEIENPGPFTVHFVTNGIVATPSDITGVIKGSAISTPSIVEKEHKYKDSTTGKIWVFKYWYVGVDDTKEYEFNTPIKNDITLTCKWEEYIKTPLDKPVPEIWDKTKIKFATVSDADNGYVVYVYEVGNLTPLGTKNVSYDKNEVELSSIITKAGLDAGKHYIVKIEAKETDIYLKSDLSDDSSELFKPAKPQYTPDSYVGTVAIDVNIKSTISNATLSYTVDGTTIPTAEEGTKVDAKETDVNVAVTTTIKAIAVRFGIESDCSEATFYIAEKLATPSNLKWDKAKITFDEVPNAKNYDIIVYKVGETEPIATVSTVDGTETGVDLDTYIDLTGTNKYVVEIIAKGDGIEYVDSDKKLSDEIYKPAKPTFNPDGTVEEYYFYPDVKATISTIEDKGTIKYTESTTKGETYDETDYAGWSTYTSEVDVTDDDSIYAVVERYGVYSDLAESDYKKKSVLNPPTDFKWNKAVLSFATVSNADKGYTIKVYKKDHTTGVEKLLGERELTTNVGEKNLSDLIEDALLSNTNNSFIAKVKANGTEKYIESIFAESPELRKPEPPITTKNLTTYYEDDIDLPLISTMSEAKIRWTAFGDPEPTEITGIEIESGETAHIDKATTVKAIAIKNGLTSEVAEFVVNMKGKLDDPTGYKWEGTVITFATVSNADEGYTIEIYKDGDTTPIITKKVPSETGTIARGKVSVDIKEAGAITSIDDLDGHEVYVKVRAEGTTKMRESDYSESPKITKPEAPIFTPDGTVTPKAFYGNITVNIATLSTSVVGGEIYYHISTNGTETITAADYKDTSKFTKYTTNLTITETTYVYAVVEKDGLYSEVAKSEYKEKFNQDPPTPISWERKIVVLSTVSTAEKGYTIEVYKVGDTTPIGTVSVATNVDKIDVSKYIANSGLNAGEHYVVKARSNETDNYVESVFSDDSPELFKPEAPIFMPDGTVDPYYFASSLNIDISSTTVDADPTNSKLLYFESTSDDGVSHTETAYSGTTFVNYATTPISPATLDDYVYAVVERYGLYSDEVKSIYKLKTPHDPVTNIKWDGMMIEFDTVSTADNGYILDIYVDGVKVDETTIDTNTGKKDLTSNIETYINDGKTITVDIKVKETSIHLESNIETSPELKKPEKPTYSIDGTNIDGSVKYLKDEDVAITSITLGVEKIIYTTDGTDPRTSTTTNTIMNGDEVNIDETTTIKAIAVKNGLNSDVSEITINIKKRQDPPTSLLVDDDMKFIFDDVPTADEGYKIVIKDEDGNVIETVDVVDNELDLSTYISATSDKKYDIEVLCKETVDYRESVVAKYGPIAKPLPPEFNLDGTVKPYKYVDKLNVDILDDKVDGKVLYKVVHKEEALHTVADYKSWDVWTGKDIALDEANSETIVYAVSTKYGLYSDEVKSKYEVKKEQDAPSDYKWNKTVVTWNEVPTANEGYKIYIYENGGTKEIAVVLIPDGKIVKKDLADIIKKGINDGKSYVVRMKSLETDDYKESDLSAKSVAIYKPAKVIFNPDGVEKPYSFKNELKVNLSTTEADGEIYYTVSKKDKESHNEDDYLKWTKWNGNDETIKNTEYIYAVVIRFGIYSDEEESVYICTSKSSGGGGSSGGGSSVSVDSGGNTKGPGYPVNTPLTSVDMNKAKDVTVLNVDKVYKVQDAVTDFVVKGDVTKLAEHKDVNPEEVIKLLQLITTPKGDSNSSGITTGTKENLWHKIADGVWYYEQVNNGLVKGWHNDPEDNQIYHLDEVTGLMSIGYTKIGNDVYYFSNQIVSPNWYKDEVTNKWGSHNEVVKSLGAMYVNELTPDGYVVDEKGHVNVNEVPKVQKMIIGSNDIIGNTNAANVVGLVNAMQPVVYKQPNTNDLYMTNNTIVRENTLNQDKIVNDISQAQNVYSLLKGEKISTGLGNEEYKKDNWRKIRPRVWYYEKSNGERATGWMQDPEDYYIYYLDPITTIMAVGWTQIDGKWYFFSDQKLSPNWYEPTRGTNNWACRGDGTKSLGALYINEMTPDGFKVDAMGVYIDETKKSAY